MGQVSEEWFLRAQAAVSGFESLFSRVSLIADEGAKKAIMLWIGLEDVPGNPAERYRTVLMDLSEAETGILSAVASDIAESRVSQLEAAVAELNSKVVSAEAAYGTTLAPAGTDAGIVPGTGRSSSFLAGSIGLLALVVIPVLAS